jgi:hypothetical protein
LALVQVNLVETEIPVFLVAYRPLEVAVGLGQVITEVQAVALAAALQVHMPHQQVRLGKETTEVMQLLAAAVVEEVLGVQEAMGCHQDMVQVVAQVFCLPLLVPECFTLEAEAEAVLLAPV